MYKVKIGGINMFESIKGFFKSLHACTVGALYSAETKLKKHRLAHKGKISKLQQQVVKAEQDKYRIKGKIAKLEHEMGKAETKKVDIKKSLKEKAEAFKKVSGTLTEAEIKIVENDIIALKNSYNATETIIKHGTQQKQALENALEGIGITIPALNQEISTMKTELEMMVSQEAILKITEGLKDVGKVDYKPREIEITEDMFINEAKIQDRLNLNKTSDDILGTGSRDISNLIDSVDQLLLEEE